tara:strand:- start:318 stop:509 length:192 start_codon:yes stop_codon:yes gene_type:complete
MNEQRKKNLRSVIHDLYLLSEQLNREASGENDKDNAEALYSLEEIIDGVIEAIDKIIDPKRED